MAGWPSERVPQGAFFRLGQYFDPVTLNLARPASSVLALDKDFDDMVTEHFPVVLAFRKNR